MSFKEMDNQIKHFYNSTSDNLVDDFYNVVLSQAVRYDRLSGFFKSDSLAIAARGISKLIENDGHMRLLCGAHLSQEDLIAIENSEDLKDIVNKNFLDEYENLENQLIKNHVLLLGWMISNGFLEIKIGINTDGENYYPNGMLHSKRGILYDENDDCILFMGSVNETKFGWTKNIEDIRVDKGWKDYSIIKGPIDNFEELWNGNVDSLLVFELPDDSKEVLIKDAPKNKKQVGELIKKINEIKLENPKDKRILFPHQKEAIKSWLNNNKKGILEMATGTGKTFTALKCLEEVAKHENILVVIACPYAHIINQWENDIFNLNLGFVHNFYGDANPHWRSEFHELKSDINLKVNFKKPNIILTTHNTFSMEDFIDYVDKCNVNSLLIVDEMHHVGAKGFSKGLDANYTYKLGLSATPSRYMDYDGTECLMLHFDKVVYKFTIEDALNKINPITNKSFLTPYKYYPIKVDLSNSELQDYKKYNKQIAQLYNADEDITDNLTGLFNKRRKIINNAEQKYVEFRKILQKIDDKDHLIVFCSDEQMDDVLRILAEENFTPKHKFTQDEGTKPKKEFGGLSQRQFLLKDFDSGVCKALVAIKCLDEGVDVPSANKVIIMSSTTNPAEYIQRRGRVLRRSKGKDFAHIYDLCVIPESDDRISDTIIEKERKRLVEFTKTAYGRNKLDCINLFKKWGIL